MTGRSGVAGESEIFEETERLRKGGCDVHANTGRRSPRGCRATTISSSRERSRTRIASRDSGSVTLFFRSPLARPSQAAAIATLAHEEEIHERSEKQRNWMRELTRRSSRSARGSFPSRRTSFSPHDAEEIARELAKRNSLIKPLGDARLGRGYMRVTTALPERFIAALAEILGRGDDRTVRPGSERNRSGATG
jgi:hypothetical protein